MSNRRALYRPAFLFEQHRPLICNMLCSSITRRSHSHCTHTHARALSVCLSPPRAHILPTHTHTHTHTPHTYLVCVDRKTLKYVACPQNFGSFCCIFSYAIEKAWYLFSFFFFYVFLFSAQTSQMDILIGTFGTVSILCWNGRQVSGWRGRGRADWCVARRA